MIASFPVLSISLATKVNGDTVYDVIATCAGVKDTDSADLLDLIVECLQSAERVTAGLSISVSDATLTAPVQVYEMAVAVALAIVDRLDRVVPS